MNGSDRVINGRYRIEKEIGRGGMGVVFHAFDMQLNRYVALKLLNSSHSSEKSFQRFKNEIYSVVRLEHPNIIRIYDAGFDRCIFYVMQFIDGIDLSKEMALKKRLSLSESLHILNQAASALDFAHSKGYYHRDVKPGNVLLDTDRNVFLVDFGISCSADFKDPDGGNFVGTVEYASPEHLTGGKISGRSDQYSLASIAYEMITGGIPFYSPSGNKVDVAVRQINEEPQDPRKYSNIPEYAARAIMKALAKKPEDRFPTCGAFVSALSGMSNDFILTSGSNSQAFSERFRSPKKNPAGPKKLDLSPMGTIQLPKGETTMPLPDRQVQQPQAFSPGATNLIHNDGSKPSGAPAPFPRSNASVGNTPSLAPRQNTSSAPFARGSASSFASRQNESPAPFAGAGFEGNVPSFGPQQNESPAPFAGGGFEGNVPSFGPQQNETPAPFAGGGFEGNVPSFGPQQNETPAPFAGGGFEGNLPSFGPQQNETSAPFAGGGFEGNVPSFGPQQNETPAPFAGGGFEGNVPSFAPQQNDSPAPLSRNNALRGNGFGDRQRPSFGSRVQSGESFVKPDAASDGMPPFGQRASASFASQNVAGWKAESEAPAQPVSVKGGTGSPAWGDDGGKDNSSYGKRNNFDNSAEYATQQEENNDDDSDSGTPSSMLRKKSGLLEKNSFMGGRSLGKPGLKSKGESADGKKPMMRGWGGSSDGSSGKPMLGSKGASGDKPVLSSSGFKKAEVHSSETPSFKKRDDSSSNGMPFAPVEKPSAPEELPVPKMPAFEKPEVPAFDKPASFERNVESDISIPSFARKHDDSFSSPFKNNYHSFKKKDNDRHDFGIESEEPEANADPVRISYDRDNGKDYEPIDNEKPDDRKESFDNSSFSGSNNDFSVSDSHKERSGGLEDALESFANSRRIRNMDIAEEDKYEKGRSSENEEDKGAYDSRSYDSPNDDDSFDSASEEPKEINRETSGTLTFEDIYGAKATADERRKLGLDRGDGNPDVAGQESSYIIDPPEPQVHEQPQAQPVSYNQVPSQSQNSGGGIVLPVIFGILVLVVIVGGYLVWQNISSTNNSLNLANAAFEKGDYGTASELYKAQIAHVVNNDDKKEVLYRFVYSSMKDGKMDDAALYGKQLRDIDSNKFDSQPEFSAIYAYKAKESNNFKVARDYYEEAIKLDPSNYEVAHEYADLCMKNGDTEKAEDIYYSLLKTVVPEYRDKTYESLSDVYLKSGDMKSAYKILNTAKANGSKVSWTPYVKAVKASGSKIQIFENLAEFANSDEQKVRSEYAAAAFDVAEDIIAKKGSNSPEAKKYLSIGRKADPSMAEGKAEKAYEAGDSLFGSGQYKDAAKKYGYALVLDPESSKAAYKQVLSFAKAGNKQAVLENADRAIALNKENAEAQKEIRALVNKIKNPAPAASVQKPAASGRSSSYSAPSSTYRTPSYSAPQTRKYPASSYSAPAPKPAAPAARPAAPAPKPKAAPVPRPRQNTGRSTIQLNSIPSSEFKSYKKGQKRDGVVEVPSGE